MHFSTKQEEASVFPKESFERLANVLGDHRQFYTIIEICTQSGTEFEHENRARATVAVL